MKEILKLDYNWNSTSVFAEIEGTPSIKNIDIHNAIINAVYKFNKKRFRVFNITNDGFDLKFYDESLIFNVQYSKYYVIDNLFY